MKKEVFKLTVQGDEVKGKVDGDLHSLAGGFATAATNDDDILEILRLAYLEAMKNRIEHEKEKRALFHLAVDVENMKFSINVAGTSNNLTALIGSFIATYEGGESLIRDAVNSAADLKEFSIKSKEMDKFIENILKDKN